jgi:hypothetical protein
LNSGDEEDDTNAAERDTLDDIDSVVMGAVGAQTTGSNSAVNNDSFFTYNKIRLRIVDATKLQHNNESLPLIESFQLVDQQQPPNDELSEAATLTTSTTTTMTTTTHHQQYRMVDGRRFELKEYKCEHMSNNEIPSQSITKQEDDAMITKQQASSNINDHKMMIMTSNNEESEEEVKSISSIEGSLKAGLGNDRSLCGNSSSTPLICLYPNMCK